MIDLSKWKQHDGGPCPVDEETLVNILCAAEVMIGAEVECKPSPAGRLRWDHQGRGGDIVGYRIAPTPSMQIDRKGLLCRP